MFLSGAATAKEIQQAIENYANLLWIQPPSIENSVNRYGNMEAKHLLGTEANRRKSRKREQTSQSRSFNQLPNSRLQLT